MIKKLLLIGLMAASSQMSAQISKGGFPKSMSVPTSSVVAAMVEVSRPDYEAAMLEDANPELNISGGYRIGLTVPTALKFPETGSFSYLEDGSIIWKTQLVVPDAKAVHVYMENFYLPQGVQMFLYNANGLQVTGAYDAESNSNTDVFVSDGIQGELVNLELNITNASLINQISFNIYKLIGDYRGAMAENLHHAFSGLSTTSDAVLTTDADCHINAACSATYNLERRSAVHINMGGSVCSGNMMNNTKRDCAPLFLTASHCNGTNSKSDATFRDWKFYFNYEFNNCEGTGSNNYGSYVLGATFLSRSDYPVGMGDNPPINGDFLLLRLSNNTSPRVTHRASYAGWDNDYVMKGTHRFIGFHHPKGADKKVTTFSSIVGTGNWGLSPNTHWRATMDEGGIEGGSSGSALFISNTHQVIGTLTGGPRDVYCRTYSLYSKFELNWLYEDGGDGTAQTRLKDHLDPISTGETKMNSYWPDGGACDQDISISEVELNNAFNIFPNPATESIVHIKFNNSDAMDLNFEIIDQLGRNLGTVKFNQVSNGNYTLDISHLSSGIYFVKVTDTKSGIYTSKKLTVQK